jgi:hypothetical protein
MVVSFLARRSFQAKGAHQLIYDLVGSFMALSCEMEINHGRIETVMAQVLLDTTDIDT